ncbi:MAG: polysaccharide deacetylase family protein [Elusimicrobia bacterium]|nr:polysaccharide deacetylase family protein [Elusimicrobiota bacterium]
MRPAFIVSLDCEGKWGMADHLEGAHARLGSAELAAAYEKLCALFDRRGVKATFAFVGAFTMSEDEVRSRLSLFSDVGPRTKAWLAPFMTDLSAGRTDGWLAPAALAAVARSGAHEIGSHGFSHLPLVEGEIDLAEFRREFASVRALDAFSRQKDGLTLVYPRDQVGFEDRLAEAGFIGYRESMAARKGERASSRRHLIDEIHPFPRAQAHPAAGSGVTVIPGGRFLNWRSGPRALIPAAWTVRGWRKTFEDAVRAGGVAHLWSHPHNFVTGRDMYELLDAVLAAAAPLIRSGALWNPTMKEYALARKA